MAVLFSDTSHGGDVLSAGRKRDGRLPSGCPWNYTEGKGLDTFILQRSSTLLASVDFLPVLKHRDSGIVVVPVVHVSLTVASSRRGEMESYTVSARV